MTLCREEALRWVHRYAAGGAVFALLPLPFSTSTGLATMETHMMNVIGEIYGDHFSAPATAAAGGTFMVAGQALKFVAAKAAAPLTVLLGPVVRGLIAAAAVEAIGHSIVNHYERKYPAKPFTKTP